MPPVPRRARRHAARSLPFALGVLLLALAALPAPAEVGFPPAPVLPRVNLVPPLPPAAGREEARVPVIRVAVKLDREADPDRVLPHLEAAGLRATRGTA